MNAKNHYFHAFRILIAIFFTLFLFFFTPGFAHATTNKWLTSCTEFDKQFDHFNVVLYVDNYNYECSPVLDDSSVYLQNFQNIPETINVDLWQTLVPHSGGARYDDIGRTGWIIYPNNGSYYDVTYSLGAQLGNPSYSCNWEAFNGPGGPAYDYQCAQIPNY